MIEAESYDARGVLCQNTWGTDFGAGGYVRIGWKTLATARYTMAPIAVDWVPQTTEELAEAAA
jgi:C1A family cysteine protease